MHIAQIQGSNNLAARYACDRSHLTVKSGNWSEVGFSSQQQGGRCFPPSVEEAQRRLDVKEASQPQSAGRADGDDPGDRRLCNLVVWTKREVKQ